MTRGNQREKARAKNLEKAAKTKTKNTMSGNEFAREKERVAAIMQEKQKKGPRRKHLRYDFREKKIVWVRSTGSDLPFL
ncbi:hypothetical protein TCE0_034f09985 [Talaromyces pinophilus]|uniref:Small EDRK-rich factor-like N-terminal domain-containing protein n=1 Tax=Talaromyces pinophilus TaxID=128442 RepID=A0A6V8HBR9_TALPI|nr:hypothetical protein TCE0_034f09985 [Talaromyces pinophilus]